MSASSLNLMPYVLNFSTHSTNGYIGMPFFSPASFPIPIIYVSVIIFEPYGSFFVLYSR
jgi:hypothetical protein